MKKSGEVTYCFTSSSLSYVSDLSMYIPVNYLYFFLYRITNCLLHYFDKVSISATVLNLTASFVLLERRVCAHTYFPHSYFSYIYCTDVNQFKTSSAVISLSVRGQTRLRKPLVLSWKYNAQSFLGESHES